MGSFQTVRTIARFEALILFRSWFFRIFTILIMLFLVSMNIGMLSDSGGMNWVLKALPANIPYFNILILNVAQTFIAMFLALDFLRRDKKLDTSEVIYTRSMTNWDYVWGKTIGVLIVFMVLNLLVLLTAFIINLAIPGIEIDPWAYLYYPLVIGIPSLIFLMGLSFLIMSLVRNQAIALVLLLGYSGFVIFTTKDKVDYLFDFIGMRIPMMHSDFIGFGFENALFLQRGLYLILGLSMIFASILLLKRLPQSRVKSVLAWVLMILFALVGFGMAGKYAADFQRGKKFRGQLVELHDRYDKELMAKMFSQDLAIQHQERQLEVKSRMGLWNNNAKTINRLIICLNPGMKVDQVTINDQPTTFERDKSILIIPLSGDLLPGDSVFAGITYKGTIDERMCNLDIDDDQLRVKYGSSFVVTTRKRHAILEPDMVLLTPESMWYPVPGTGHGSILSVHPRWSFARFEASITTTEGMIPIMQGESREEGNTWYFKPEERLSGISLIIGPYETASVVVDSTSYELYTLPGHDYYKGPLNLIGDTIPYLIRDMKGDVERTLAYTYPFARLRMIEVPVQFYSYQRLWTTGRDVVQPEMVLLPEMAGTLTRASFLDEYKRTVKRNSERDEAMSEKDMQVQVFKNFILQNFSPAQSGNMMRFDRSSGPVPQTTDKPFTLFPLFFNYVNHFESRDYPVFNTAFEAYLNNQTSNSFFGGMGGGMSPDEQASLALMDESLESLLRSIKDPGLLKSIINAKGVYLFTYLEAIAGMDEFRDFLEEQLLNNKFNTILLVDFSEAFEAQFGFNPLGFFNDWYTISSLPGFLVTDFRVIETQEGDRTKYQLLFKVSNPSPAEGVLKITLRSGGRGGGGGRMGGGGPMVVQVGFGMAGRNTANERLYRIKSNEAKQIGIVLDEQPRGLSVNTMVSTNLPNNMTFPFPDLEKIRSYPIFEGERPIPLITTLRLPDEIIVDNEDPGFKILDLESVSRLAKWLKINENKTVLPYSNMQTFRPPLEWVATTQSGFYGDFIRSAYYTRAGQGELSVEWTTVLPEPGYYEVYTYLQPMIARMGMRGRGGDRGGGGGAGGPGGGGGETAVPDEYHFFIHHDEGSDEVSVALKDAASGWNPLGTFYYSPDTARITLTNRNSGRVVVADAVKWVKQK